ncbi:MAG: prolyl-tRNA synthetase associated domain-containing protein [Spirochaetota bacterium]
MDEKERKVYEALESLGIPYTRHEHPAVYTVDEAKEYWENIKGLHSKNLFLRNKKGEKHYLAVLLDSRKISIKEMENKISDKELSFASPERLAKYLDLTPGAVSPFGLINDVERHVILILDRALIKADYVNFHPNINTVTITIKGKDFGKFIAWCGHQTIFLDL